MGDTLIGSNMMPSDLQVQPLGNSLVTLASTAPDMSGALVDQNAFNKDDDDTMAVPSSKPYPGLQVAVEHLLELAEVMTSEEYGFKDEDILRIDEVIETLEALEAEKRRLHDRLETASIKAANLRSRFWE